MAARRLYALAIALVGIALVSCTHGGRGAGSVAGESIKGEVVQRAEGYAERPGWADANRPWSRQGDTLRVVGYVGIAGIQRLETGYRAADSYARAELVRFLSVRVVSVLEDTLKSGEAGKISEQIEVTASSWINDLTIAQRYWERRKDGSDERLHIWSRLDIDSTAVAALLQRALQDSKDLRLSPEQLGQAIQARWSKFADVDAVSPGDPQLPAGTFRPEWAKTGDQATDADFQFVCHGLAEDEKTARALAQARCNEKICRLFGVQITARTKVVEDLQGLTAQSEVSEQCANVRVVGRDTRYQSGECGPQGCVQWILQVYPRSAYEEEKKRLEQPTIIRQQVVIQEGSKVYRDPAACEASLRAYGAVQGVSATAFEQRKAHLTSALRVCQDIDSRDSGLFTALNNLLTLPLANFSHDRSNPYDERLGSRDYFLYAGQPWRTSIETQRFLTDRIQMVLGLVNDAILPMRLMDILRSGADDKTVDAVVRELIKVPFSNRPSSPHHFINVHAWGMDLGDSRKVAYSRRYRDFLIDQASRVRLSCTGEGAYNGAHLLGYLGADRVWDEREWQVALSILRNTQEGRAHLCLGPMWRDQPHTGVRAQRLDQIAKMIFNGEIRAKNPDEQFASWVRMLPESEQPELFLKWHDRFTSNQATRKRLAQDVTFSSFRHLSRDKDEARRQCEAMPRQVERMLSQVPEAKVEDTALCDCLRNDTVSPAGRSAIVAILFKYATDTCNAVRPEEWPGGYYAVETPRSRPYDSRDAFAPNSKIMESEFKGCFDRYQPIHGATVVTMLRTTITAGRFSNPSVEVTVSGKINQFTRQDGGRGWFSASDVATITRNLQNCITSVANGYQVPSVHSITEEKKPLHIWIQYWDTSTGTNGVE